MRILHLLQPPQFADEQATRRARPVHTILLLALALYPAGVVATTLASSKARPLLYVTHLAGAICILGLIFLLRRGHIIQAAHGLVGLIWGMVTLVGALIGTVRSPNTAIYILIILGAGLFFGRRFMLAVTGLSSLAVLILAYAEAAGWLRPLDLSVNIAQGMSYTLFFIAAAVLVHTALLRINENLEHAQSELEERRRVEEALRKSEERYRHLVEYSFEGVWQLAFDEPIPLDLPAAEQVRRIHTMGYIAECNDALARMYGYTAHTEMLGKRLLELYGGAPSEQNFYTTLALVQNGYRNKERETWEVNNRGERIYLLNNTVGIIEDEHLVAMWGTQRDITQLKRVEAELRQLNANLERRVGERTAQLETANRELEAFSYSVSHDLRTPLRSIDGYSRLLQDEYAEQLDAQGRAFLDNVRRAAQRMSTLIDELLAMSRINRAELRYSQVPLSELASEVVAELRRQDPQRQVEVYIQPGLKANGDANLLRLVLENLLSNAWKFTCQQEQAAIEFGRQGMDGQAAYYVSDNGAGFDMRFSNKLFRDFQRLHAVDEFPGSGVGLANVKRVIRRHGGRVWAVGEVGRGATFYFTLPA